MYFMNLVYWWSNKEGGGWAGIQQKVISGEYDFSHALAGMPIASTLGINGNTPMYALLSLDFNGNGITFSNKVIKEMEKFGLDPVKRPVTAAALKKVVSKFFCKFLLSTAVLFQIFPGNISSIQPFCVIVYSQGDQ